MNPGSRGRGVNLYTTLGQTSNGPPLSQTASPMDQFFLHSNRRLELAGMQQGLNPGDLDSDPEDALPIWKGLDIRQRRGIEWANLNLLPANECDISYFTKPQPTYKGWRGDVQKNAIHPVNAVDIDELKDLVSVMDTKSKAWENLASVLMLKREFNKGELLLYWTPIFHGVIVPIKLLRGLLGKGITWSAATKSLGLLEVPWAICQLMGIAEPITSITKTRLGTWNTSQERAMIADMDATISSQLEHINSREGRMSNDETREVLNLLYIHENVQKQWTAVLKLADILGIDNRFSY